jgi:endonuclease G
MVNDLSDRAGYDDQFLGTRIPIPILDDVSTALLPYTHFSVLMRLDKRLAAVTALGIDGEKLMNLDRDGIQWRLDPRLSEDQQTGERVYARNDIDGGHLVRTASAVWGETLAEAATANEDTFHYTNAAPQAATFNQGLELWLGLESYLLENAADNRRRLVIFTGPIFSDADPVYRGAEIPCSSLRSPCSLKAAPWLQRGTWWTRHHNWQSCRMCHRLGLRKMLPRLVRSGRSKCRSGILLP